jgi:hypothetical protein
MLFGVIGGWGRVYQDYLWVTKSLVNPPLRIDVVWVIGGVGAGLSRLFVGDKIPREPAPTNFGYCDRTFINNLLFPLFPPL